MLKLLTTFIAAMQVASSNKCGRPGWPAFSDSLNFAVKDFYDVGETIVYRCRSGYKFLSRNPSICQGNGTWTQPPICSTKFKFQIIQSSSFYFIFSGELVVRQTVPADVQRIRTEDRMEF